MYVSDVAEIGRAVGGKDAAIVLYCNGGNCGKSKRLAAELVDAGYTNVRRYQLGIPTWRALGGVCEIEADAVRRVLADDRTAVVIDTREAGEFQRGSLPRARNVPHTRGTSWSVAAAADAGYVAEALAREAFHNVAESRQPYHAGFGTARAAGTGLSRLLASVRRFGRTSMNRMLRQYAEDGHEICGAGVVAGSLIDPRTIGNDHIRIHALEGQLFRTVVQTSLSRRGVHCSVWRDRDLFDLAGRQLRKPERALRSALLKLGRGVQGSWRAEQKAAALAAWMVLDGQDLR